GGDGDGGGGGAGFGGAVFVKKGTLTLKNVSFTSNSAVKGTGGTVANDGVGKGGAVFICTNDLDSVSTAVNNMATGANGGCSGTIDETNSCGVTFGTGAVNTAVEGQADLFWTGATGVAHSTTNITDGCNAAPVASAVSFTGTASVGETLTGTYTYSDAETPPDAEAGSTYRWVRSADDAVDVNDTDAVASTATGGAPGSDAYTVTAADRGNYLFYCVTPAASAGTSPGSEACSTGTQVSSTSVTFRVTTTGTGSGLTWATAANLQDALHVAQQGDQLWVAAGVYYPDEGAGALENNPMATFNILPGVAVYGGFAGTETALTERDLATNRSILSGDIDRNDNATDGVVLTHSDIARTNARHVVFLDGTTAAGTITSSTRLDGFTITGGSDLGMPNFFGGGGLYCLGWIPPDIPGECSPTLTNLVFQGNRSSTFGGAMVSYGAGRGKSNPTLTNVVFQNNFAAQDGGALYNTGSFGGESSPTLVNVTFAGNDTGGSGGAIFNAATDSGVSTPTLTNVILWGNTTARPISNLFATPRISHSIIQGSGSGAWFPMLGTDSGNNLDADPLFTKALEGDLTLHTGSPAIDAGTDAGALTTDILGNSRVGTTDIGAYEFAVAGLCGDAHGLTVSSAPTADLCSAGTASAVTGTGPWSWTCVGSTTVNCSASLANSGGGGYTPPPPSDPHPPPVTDTDNDGIPDTQEGAVDTDNDGVNDAQDSDSDNDGIPDIQEGAIDTDNDGINDARDSDSDG
ncbi:thrombospondin type 3 repeat-containing protein, partial [Thiospirillum jenense]